MSKPSSTQHLHQLDCLLSAVLEKEGFGGEYHEKTSAAGEGELPDVLSFFNPRWRVAVHYTVTGARQGLPH